MSEAEKKRRSDYRQNRQKWLRICSLILAGLTLVTAVLGIVFFELNESTYVGYTEQGDVGYTVYLKENEYFEQDSLGEDNIYVASLIDRVHMDFTYELIMDKPAIYHYTYGVDALIVIRDNLTKKLIYCDRLSADSAALIPDRTVESTQPERELDVFAPVEIRYDDYNQRAKQIVDALSLQNVTCTLEVAMQIDVVGSVEDLAEDKENQYSFMLSIPLLTEKVELAQKADVPTGLDKLIMAKDGIARNVFMVLAIVFLCLTVLYAIALVIFVILTRNTDINYEIKVKRTVANYKSYIQKIVNPIDLTGYRVMYVEGFGDLLEIRDTIHSPILMNENEDKTCTSFMIPTDTDVVYMYEIKVADFDEIYGNSEQQEPAQDQSKLVILDENVDKEALDAALEQPDVPLSNIDYDEDDDDDNLQEGVEVIGVVWPERPHHNKVYRYDPNGEQIAKGDIVLVPTKDVHQNKEIIRKATVEHGNHKVPADQLKHPLKKIIGVFKRKAEEVLMPKEEVAETKGNKKEKENKK